MKERKEGRKKGNERKKETPTQEWKFGRWCNLMKSSKQMEVTERGEQLGEGLPLCSYRELGRLDRVSGSPGYLKTPSAADLELLIPLPLLFLRIGTTFMGPQALLLFVRKQPKEPRDLWVDNLAFNLKSLNPR